MSAYMATASWNPSGKTRRALPAVRLRYPLCLSRPGRLCGHSTALVTHANFFCTIMQSRQSKLFCAQMELAAERQDLVTAVDAKCNNQLQPWLHPP